MPNLTPNYGLKKPLGTESAKISEINDNFDVLDAILTPTVTDTVSPPDVHSGGSKIAAVLSWLCNRVKAITGKSAWQLPPSVTLEDAAAHIRNGTHALATENNNGFLSAADKKRLDGATPAVLPNRITVNSVADLVFRILNQVIDAA